MRLGVNATFRHSTPEEWAKKLRELGCRAAAVPSGLAADPHRAEAYAAAAREYDLQFAEVGIWKNQLAADPEERKAVVEESVACLKLADCLGARCCVNVAGAAGPHWSGGYRENFSEATWKQTVAVIREIIDRADPKRTFFAIEPMPWMYPTGPDEYLELIRDVDRECFAVHMDIVNLIHTPRRYFFHEAFMDECFAKLGPRIRSCHLKDSLLEDGYTFRLCEKPCGEGTLNLGHYLKKIAELDADMPVLLEHLDDETAYVESLAYIRKTYPAFFA